MKKHLAFILCIIMLLSAVTVLPITASAKTADDLSETGAAAELAETGWSIPNEATFANRLAQLKEKYYPRGYSGAYYENGSAMAWQCYGFAVQMLHDIFGINYYADGFVNRADYTMGELNAGDVVRIRGNTHSIFITKVTNEGYYFCDANWDYNNGVRWDAYYTKEEMAATFTYKIHVPGSNLKGTKEARTGLYADTPNLRAAKCSAPGITVYWYSVEDAVSYRVYYKKGDQKNWKILGDTKNNYYQFIGDLEYGTDYTFTVRALDVYKVPVSDYNKNGITVKYLVAPPEMKTCKAGVDKITVGWDAVKGVTTYRLYVKSDKDTNWHTVANVNGTSYKFTGGKAHTRYQFTVRCLNSHKQLISGCSIKKPSADYITYATQLSAPQNIVATTTTQQGTIRIKWDAVNNAKKYQVFVTRPGIDKGWKKLGKTTRNYYYHLNSMNNTVYRFTVRCIDDKGAFMSDYHDIAVIRYYSYPEKLKVVKHDENGGVKVSWKATGGADSYILYYKTAESGGWQRVETDDPIAGTSYIFTGCQNGVEYTFTVRARDQEGNTSSYDGNGVSITYTVTPPVEPENDEPTGEPAVEDPTGEPAVENPTGEPAPENPTGEPVVENPTGEPASEPATGAVQ